MSAHTSKIIVLTCFLLLVTPVTTLGEEKQQPAQEELQEFLKQYLAAFQDGNTQEIEQLVQKNRE